MDTCPKCGYCPHCGRSASPYPIRPWPYSVSPTWVDPSILGPYGYPTVTYSSNSAAPAKVTVMN